MRLTHLKIQRLAKKASNAHVILQSVEADLRAAKMRATGGDLTAITDALALVQPARQAARPADEAMAKLADRWHRKEASK